MRKKAIEMNKIKRPIWDSLNLFLIAKATVKEVNIIPVRYEVGIRSIKAEVSLFGRFLSLGHEIFKQYMNCLPIICLVCPIDM